MLRILQVLSNASTPMKLTGIILSVKNLRPIRKTITLGERSIEVPPYIQLELVSALAGESVSWWQGDYVNGEDRLEAFHKEASKLYVSFGRSMRTLVIHGLVSARVHTLGARQLAYWITDKGREVLQKRA
jgi:hypothetical protein